MTALAFGAFMDGIGINFMMNPDMFPVEGNQRLHKDDLYANY